MKPILSIKRNMSLPRFDRPFRTFEQSRLNTLWPTGPNMMRWQEELRKAHVRQMIGKVKGLKVYTRFFSGNSRTFYEEAARNSSSASPTRQCRAALWMVVEHATGAVVALIGRAKEPVNAGFNRAITAQARD